MLDAGAAVALAGKIAKGVEKGSCDWWLGMAIDPRRSLVRAAANDTRPTLAGAAPHSAPVHHDSPNWPCSQSTNPLTLAGTSRGDG